MNEESKSVIVGYTPVFRGEMDGAECQECGGPLTNPHIGFMLSDDGLEMFGPVCENCATTE